MQSIATKVIRFIDLKNQIRVGQYIATDRTKAQVLCQENVFGSLELSREIIQIKKVLAPVLPSQILGIGLNYRQHAQETQMPIPRYPVVFFKNVASLQHPNDPILLPSIATTPNEVDYEAELAVVLKKDCKNVSREQVKDYIFGYTAANDVSARRWQGKKGGNQWSRAKSFDTFCPLGPELVTPEHLPDPQNLDIRLTRNGQTLQQSNTKDMIFDVKELVSQLSQDMTLIKGTVILTGTPEGVGYTRDPPIFLQPGDKVSVWIEGIGHLSNTVQKAN